MDIKIWAITIMALGALIAGCATTQDDNTAVLPDEKPIIITKKTAINPIKIAVYQYVKTLDYMETEDFDENPDTLLFTRPMESSQDQLPQYKYDSKIWIEFSRTKNNSAQIKIYNYSDQLLIRQKTDNDMHKIADFINGKF